MRPAIAGAGSHYPFGRLAPTREGGMSEEATSAEGVELDPAELAERAVYRLLTALVVPRPIAWVSTYGAQGVRNVAPHSYANIVSSDPPVVHFTSSGEKDTLRNVRRREAFVVNVVDADLLEVMNLTAADFPPDEDEFAWAGLASEPAAAVDAPRVAAAKGHLECTLREVVPVGNGNLVLGDVRHIHVAGSVWRDGQIDQKSLRAVGRLSGGGYSIVDRVTQLPRPTWEQVRQRAGRA